MPDNVLGNAASYASTGATLGSIVPGVGTLIGGGIGLAAGLAKGLLGSKQVGLANGINPNLPNYVTSPYAKQSLGIASQMFNGRMPGSAQAQEAILSGQANQVGNIQRNATDSSTALLLGQEAEAQAGQSTNDLAVKTGQYKAGLLDNLQHSYDQLTGEHQKEYNSQLNRYGIDTQAKSDLMKAGLNNEFSGVNDAASIIALLDQSGAFKKKGTSVGMGKGFYLPPNYLNTGLN